MARWQTGDSYEGVRVVEVVLSVCLIGEHSVVCRAVAETRGEVVCELENVEGSAVSEHFTELSVGLGVSSLTWRTATPKSTG